jgi:aspartokinase/homoserine dehydrogenase 1
MIVMKFGGTSVSSRKNIDQIESILNNKKENYIVVVSAFYKVTNIIEQIAVQAITNDFTSLLEEFRAIHFSIIKELFPVKHQTEAILKVQQKCNDLETICNGIKMEIIKKAIPTYSPKIVDLKTSKKLKMNNSFAELRKYLLD